MPSERLTSVPSKSRMWQSKVRPGDRWSLGFLEREAWRDSPSFQTSRDTGVEMQIAPGMGSPHHLSHLVYSQGLPVSTLHDGLMHNRELPGARFGGNGYAGFRPETRVFLRAR